MGHCRQTGYHLMHTLSQQDMESVISIQKLFIYFTAATQACFPVSSHGVLFQDHQCTDVVMALIKLFFNYLHAEKQRLSGHTFFFFFFFMVMAR